MERPREAEEMLRESLRYDPQLAEAHYRLGRALERQGRETEAVEEYQVAVSGDSKSADACYALAFLLRKLHRDKEASTMFAEFEMRKQREDASAAAPVMH
jgi:tetratricopeptide (TPR) repeat protein